VLVKVDMVHALIVYQETTQVLFHDKTVLRNEVRFGTGVAGAVHEYVAMTAPLQLTTAQPRMAVSARLAG